jgi:hypothetical protein
MGKEATSPSTCVMRPLIEKALRKCSNVKETAEGWRATCPLCEHHRTFLVNNEGQWTCFACSEFGGLKWLYIKLGLQVPSELEALSEHHREAARKAKIKEKREEILLPEYILGAWDECPIKLLETGFTEETLERFNIGYDHKRDRIIFPVRTARGELAAVVGRAWESWSSPRYKVYEVNEDQGGELQGVVDDDYQPLNRNHLFGLHLFYHQRRAGDVSKPLILVEGFKGCMWLHQHGFTHTCALQSFSITRAQLYLLKSLPGPYYIFLDHEPGKAFPDPDKNWHCYAVRVAKTLRAFGKALVCHYPGYTPEDPYKETPLGTSPDDLGEERIRWILENAKPPTAASRRERRWPRLTPSAVLGRK